MRRDLAALDGASVDVAIVGGGIAGATIARDAARRGLRVALLERRDFSSGTSAGSSKLVHGGLRYLKRLELGLVRESLKERGIWQAIAPHQVRLMPFLLPVVRGGPMGRPALAAALSLYDVLARGGPALADADQRAPRHRWLPREAALAREPVLEQPGLTGAYLFHDCQMLSPERLGLECLIDAVEHGALIANYVDVTGFARSGGRIAGVVARDALSGRAVEVRALVVVNAAGPWADGILGLARPGSADRLVRSKGIHIVVPALTRTSALAAQGRGSHVFVVPWRGASLVGTTDTPYDGPLDQVVVEPGDVEALIEALGRGVPAARLSSSQVLHAYAALRPLVDEGASRAATTYGASRRAAIVDYVGNPDLDGLVSALGGKWTTARLVAERTVDLIARRLGGTYRACDTHIARLPHAPEGAFASFEPRPREVLAAVSPSAHAAWRHTYGRRMAALAGYGPDALLALAPGVETTAAEVVHAVREEMAVRLEDVVARRTGLGALGAPPEAALEAAADLMAGELGWSAERRAEELDIVRRGYVSATAATGAA